MHPAASMKTPEDTKNLKLIVEKILVQFSIALMKFIHSFDVDIEQSLPLVRTSYAISTKKRVVPGRFQAFEKLSTKDLELPTELCITVPC